MRPRRKCRKDQAVVSPRFLWNLYLCFDDEKCVILVWISVEALLDQVIIITDNAEAY